MREKTYKFWIKRARNKNLAKILFSEPNKNHKKLSYTIEKNVDLAQQIYDELTFK